MCYGKFEAAALFFVVPSLLLGHMFGFLPPEGERGLVAAFCLLASVFAARKYTQPIKDDIGDKSVFTFQVNAPPLLLAAAAAAIDARRHGIVSSRLQMTLLIIMIPS